MSMVANIEALCGDSSTANECLRFLGQRRGRDFSAEAMAVQVGLTFEMALDVAMLLARNKMATRIWVIYHECADHSVGTRLLSDGFPPIPWTCPDCEEVVIDPEALLYELSFRLPKDLGLE